MGNQEGSSLDIEERTRRLLLGHPSVRGVKLVGSRESGFTTALSDLDLEVEVTDIGRFSRDLPTLVQGLEPLGQMWDRLGDHRTYMLMLSGPLKVDIIVDVPHVDSAPWRLSKETLPQIEHHFWDWTLWLGSKHLHSQDGLVARELEKMYEHLLAPLGVAKSPETLKEAVGSYIPTRNRAEGDLGIKVDRRMEREVREVLRATGVL